MSTKNKRPVLADLHDPQPGDSAEEIARLLQCVPWLREVAEHHLSKLAQCCTWVDLEPGTTIIRQGEIETTLYVVLKGRLSVYQESDGKRMLLGELRRNQAFGESAVVGSGRRVASVIVEEACHLLALEKGPFQACLEGSPNLRHQIETIAESREGWAERQRFRPAMAELLQKLAAMTGVKEPETLRALERELHWMTLPAGVALLQAGTQGNHMYFLLAGSMNVFMPRPNGSKTLISQLSEGDIVGEIALITDAPRSADVIATADSELLRLSRTGYEMLVKLHPDTMSMLSRTLAARLVGQLQARSTVAQLSSMPIPTADECKDIVETPDLILRNLRITQMYQRLSTQLAAILGQQDANWCTFATHASKTAGYSIRSEELPGYSALLWLEDRFEVAEGLHKRMSSALSRVSTRSGLIAKLDSISDHISNCISAGNLKVFAELAPLFSAFLQIFQHGRASDPLALEDLCASLHPGDSSSGGQQILNEAFHHYVAAMFESDAKKKAEWLLLGNCKIGLHEQTRLQPYIIEALNTPLLDVLGSNRQPPITERAALNNHAHHTPSGPAVRMAVKFSRRFLTRYTMRLRLPYGDVLLGKDLERLPNRQIHPDILQHIELEELRILLTRFDRTTRGLRNSRARDWGDLNDRMNFIVNLFRSRHKSLELFDQPFFYEQRLAMQHGVVPQGRL
jgi:CRP-like cAMP-binding protein